MPPSTRQDGQVQPDDRDRQCQGCGASGAETTQIKSINLGGTKSAPDRHALSHAVYVSDEEEKLLHEAAAEGIEVFIQAVPSDSKKILT